jgi:hypothetical protein
MKSTCRALSRLRAPLKQLRGNKIPSTRELRSGRSPLLFTRHNSTLPKTQPQISGGADTLLTSVLGGSVLAFGGYTAYKAKLEPREREIYGKPFEIAGRIGSPSCCGMKDFEVVKRSGSSENCNGSLNASLLKNKQSGKLYLKKGAKSRDALIREVAVSRALAILRPGIQPQSLLMQEVQSDGSVRFYTLSEISPNSMDLEDFAKQGNCAEKLAKKPMEGLEVALAIDALFSKQSDTKLANLILIEKEDRYVVASIDHEQACSTMFSRYNQEVATKDLDRLVGYLRDLHAPEDGVPKVGMMGDPRAVNFVKTARKQMRSESVVEFYKAFAEADFSPLVDELRLMSKFSNIVTKADVIYYKKRLAGMQVKAQALVDSAAREQSPANTAI